MNIREQLVLLGYGFSHTGFLEAFPTLLESWFVVLLVTDLAED
jgi:hypothetical protein